MTQNTQYTQGSKELTHKIQFTTGSVTCREGDVVFIQGLLSDIVCLKKYQYVILSDGETMVNLKKIIFIVKLQPLKQ